MYATEKTIIYLKTTLFFPAVVGLSTWCGKIVRRFYWHALWHPVGTRHKHTSSIYDAPVCGRYTSIINDNTLTELTMSLTATLSFSSPTLSFIPVLKPSFLQILPTAAFLFFFRTDYMIPQTLTVRLFLLFSFSVLQFLVVVSVR